MNEISSEKLTLEFLQNSLRSRQIIVESALAKGGQGSVYRGTFQGKKAAIKVYEPSAEVTRVDREVEKLQQIESDYVVQLLDHGELTIQKLPCKFVIYSLINGEPLDKISEEPTGKEVRRLLHDVMRALDAFWALRIVHRDIKPGNVIRASDGRFVVIDLGLAKHLDQSTITQFGFTCGTQGYMSPEQMKGRRGLTYRSDLFSLGILAYEFASRRHPYLGIQQRVEKHNPVRLSTVSNVTEETSALVHRLLNPNPLLRANTPLSNLSNEIDWT